MRLISIALLVGICCPLHLGAEEWPAGKQLKVLEEDSFLLCAAFSTDSTLVATGDADGVVQVFEVDRGKVVATMRHAAPAYAMLFSDQDKSLIVGYYDGKIVEWNPKTGKGISSFQLEDQVGVVALAQRDDGVLLVASGGTSRLVRLLDWKSKKLLPALGAHKNSVNSVVLAPNKSFFATASTDRSVRLWTTKDNSSTVVAEHENRAVAVAFSPDNKCLVSSDCDGFLFVWDIAAGKRVARFPVAPYGIRSMAFSPDGTRLAVAGGRNLDGRENQGMVAIVETKTWKTTHLLVPTDRIVNHVAFSHDGKWLIAVGAKEAAVLYSLSR